MLRDFLQLVRVKVSIEETYHAKAKEIVIEVMFRYSCGS